MAFARINGINLHYEIRGSGPRLLFIHGIGADINHPAGLFNSPLADKFTILAFDPRGFGESDDVDTPYSIADMAEDAAGLAAAAGWDKYNLFGASMGGMVAQELVLHYPRAVKKLVLAVTHAGGSNGAPVVVESMYDLPPADMLRLSDTRLDESWMAANPELARQIVESFRLAGEKMKSNPRLMKAYGLQAQAVEKHDSYDRLPRIKVPTLAFAGRYDGGCPFEVSRSMAERIPEARFEVIESGHGTWLQDPRVWTMISDFLNE